MTKEKKSLISISVLMQVIFVFFDVFFGIYIYDLSSNLNIIILYTIIDAFVYYSFLLIIYKFLNKRFLSLLYRLSFVMGTMAIALTFTISASNTCGDTNILNFWFYIKNIKTAP